MHRLALNEEFTNAKSDVPVVHRWSCPLVGWKYGLMEFNYHWCENYIMQYILHMLLHLISATNLRFNYHSNFINYSVIH